MPCAIGSVATHLARRLQDDRVGRVVRKETDHRGIPAFAFATLATR
jgi:hypothetical protein